MIPTNSLIQPQTTPKCPKRLQNTPNKPKLRPKYQKLHMMVYDVVVCVGMEGFVPPLPKNGSSDEDQTTLCV